MSDFLFCFLKPDARRHAVNQYRHYLICRRDGCGYLDESGPQPVCTCEPTIEYFLSFKEGGKKKLRAEKEAEAMREVPNDKVTRDQREDDSEGEAVSVGEEGDQEVAEASNNR